MEAKKLLAMKLNERMFIEGGFIVRTSPTQWRVVQAKEGQRIWKDTLTVVKGSVQSV